MVSWKKGKRPQTSCWLTSWLKPSGKHIFFCSLRTSSPRGSREKSLESRTQKETRTFYSQLAALATIVGYYVFRSGSYSLFSHWWQGSPLIWFFITYWGAIDWCRPFVLFYVQLSPGLGSKMELGMLCQDNSNNHLIYDQNRRFSKPVFTPAFWMRRLSIWHPSALFWFWVPWSVVSRVYIT